jgi:hypothetical protein
MTVHIQKTRYNTGDQTNRISLTSVKYSMRINEVSESRIKYHGIQGGIDVSRLHTPMWFTGSKQDAMHYAGDDGQIVVAKLLCNSPYVIDPDQGDEPNMVLGTGPGSGTESRGSRHLPQRSADLDPINMGCNRHS